MSIIAVVIVLIIVGVLLCDDLLVNSYIPIPATIKTIINLFVAVCVVLWLLQLSGLVS